MTDLGKTEGWGWWCFTPSKEARPGSQRSWAIWLILMVEKRQFLPSLIQRKWLLFVTLFSMELPTDKETEKGKQPKRQDATLHKHFLLFVLKLTQLTSAHTTAQLTSHTPNTESSKTTQVQCSPSFQGLEKLRKELRKSQENALWFAYVDLEVILVCIQTTEIQSLLSGGWFESLMNPCFPPCFHSQAAASYKDKSLTDRERPNN